MTSPNELLTDSPCERIIQCFISRGCLRGCSIRANGFGWTKKLVALKKPPGLPVRFKLSLRFFASEVRYSRYLTGSWVA